MLPVTVNVEGYKPYGLAVDRSGVKKRHPGRLLVGRAGEDMIGIPEYIVRVWNHTK